MVSVLFVITSSDGGGAEELVYKLAFGLEGTEIKPLLCSLLPLGRTASRIAQRGVPCTSLEMPAEPHLFQLVRGTVKLARLIDCSRVDLVHSFLFRANVVARLAARFSRRRPVLVSGHHSLSVVGGWRAAWAARATRRLSDRFVAVSEAARAATMRIEHAPPGKVLVIENGVDVARFEDLGREGYGTRSGPLTVCSAGRLVAVKGFDDLIRSMVIVRRRGIAAELILGGDGPERVYLRSLARSLRLDACVRFLGWQEDLRPLYTNADVFVLASREEASPTVLLEAMAAGKAIVATRVPAVTEIIRDGESGILAPPASPEALADAICLLAKDEPLRVALGARARACVAERFDLPRMINKHIELYLSLLEQRRLPPPAQGLMSSKDSFLKSGEAMPEALERPC